MMPAFSLIGIRILDALSAQLALGLRPNQLLNSFVSRKWRCMSAVVKAMLLTWLAYSSGSVAFQSSYAPDVSLKSSNWPKKCAIAFEIGNRVSLKYSPSPVMIK